MFGGRSPSLVMVGRSSIAQSSSTGPSRKACSRSESGRGTNRRSLRQSGLPENRSRSYQTVPASRAIRSVSPRTGSSGPMCRMTDWLTSRRRSAGRPNTRTSTNKRTTRVRNTAGGRPAPHQPTASAPRITQAQYPCPRNASQVATKRRAAMAGSVVICPPPDQQGTGQGVMPQGQSLRRLDRSFREAAGGRDVGSAASAANCMIRNRSGMCDSHLR